MRLGIAVSGGPDSLALLLLAQGAFPGRVEAATVDHGLRAESAEEAAFVAALCAELGVPHEILEVSVGAGNVQAEAREARYRALGGWCALRQCGALLTAHHADDQAETLLMRLNRGSGLAGLTGIRRVGRAIGPERPVLRPLLSWRKSELEAVCDEAGVRPVRDPSNADDAFDRARLRKALAAADWLDPGQLARSSDLLAEALDTLEWMAEREWAQCVVSEPPAFSYAPVAPRMIRIEVAAKIIRSLGGAAARSEIARLVERLERGENASLGGVLARCGKAKRGGAEMRVWHFAPEPARAAV